MGRSKKAKEAASTSSTSNARRTAKSLLMSTLGGARDAGRIVPGAASIFGGILSILQGLDEKADNAGVLDGLLTHVQELQAVFTKSGASDVPADMAEDVEILKSDLATCIKALEEKASLDHVQRFVNRTYDKEDLRRLSENVKDALARSQIRGQFRREKQEHLRELSRILDDLSIVRDAGFESTRSNAPSRCFEGTRVGVLERIQDWIGAPNNSEILPIFWLDGIAGVGKSTIAQTIAERGKALGLLVASFFFTRMEAARRNSKYVIPTLAYQLAQLNDILKVRIGTALEKDRLLGTKSVSQQVQQLIIEPLTNYEERQTILIVLDALDECDSRGAQDLLQVLLSHLKSTSISLRVLVTSRPESHIRAVLQSASSLSRLVLHHDVESSIVHGDITRYLHAQLLDLRNNPVYLLPDDWVRDEDVAALATRAGNLFIYAATAVRFIGYRTMPDPEARLQILLGPKSDPDLKHAHAELDELYTHILLNAVPESERFRQRYEDIMGSIILLRDPLPVAALSRFTEYEERVVYSTLSGLHSVLNVPTNGVDGPVSIYHQSLPDYITDPDRCPNDKLRIDRSKHERRLALRCLELLTTILKRDIADIGDPSLLNNEVDGLDMKVQNVIPPELKYACLHWSSHVNATQSTDAEILGLLNKFATKYMLFWLEAMSLLKSTTPAITCLKAAYEWAIRSKCEQQLISLFHDGYRLILAHFEPIKASALHVYHSALPFVPRQTVLWGTYRDQAAGSVKALQGLSNHWSACMNTLIGHTGYVTSVAFSRDGSRVASGSNDKTVRLWDAVSGEQTAVLRGHTSIVRSIAFSPDGSCVASGSGDRTARLWDVVSGEQTAVLNGHTGIVTSVAFSSEGSRVASGSHDRTIRLWDAVSGEQTAVINGHTGIITSVAFSPDGSRVASGLNDKTVRLWDAVSGEQTAVLNGHTNSVTSVAFSPDGSRVASGSFDYTVRLWDAVSGEQTAVLKGHTSKVTSVAFSHDGSRVASGSNDKTVRLWDAVSGEQTVVLNGHTRKVASVEFSHDGSRVASGSYDEMVRLWDAVSGEETAVLSGHTSIVRSVTFSPDGSRMASGSHDNTVRLWDAVSGEQMAVLEGHPDIVTSVAFSRDGSCVASGSDDCTVRLWDAVSGQQTAVLKGHTGRVTSVGFSCDGSYVASGSNDHTIGLWDAVSGEQMMVLNGHTSHVTSVAFSPDGSCVASGSWDQTVRLWDAVSGEQTAVLNGHTHRVISVAFLPDGSRMISQSDAGVVIAWDLSTLICCLNYHDPDSSFLQELTPSSIPLALDIKQQWLYSSTLRLCYIPGEYLLSTPIFTHGLRMLFGCEGGQVVLLDISPHLNW